MRLEPLCCIFYHFTIHMGVCLVGFKQLHVKSHMLQNSGVFATILSGT